MNRQQELAQWIGTWLERELNLAPTEIEADKTFVRYGMDSMHAMMLVGDLEQLLARRLPPTLAWDYPTLKALGDHLGWETGPVNLERTDSEILVRLDDLSEDEIDRLLEEKLGKSATVFKP